MTIKSQKRSYGTSIPVPKYHQVSQQPLIQPSQGGVLQSFKESLVGGFGAGIGMNVADRAISSIFGPRKVEVQHTNVENECQDIIKLYKETLSKGEFITQTLQEKYEKCKPTW
jgi:hypothetical protein